MKFKDKKTAARLLNFITDSIVCFIIKKRHRELTKHRSVSIRFHYWRSFEKIYNEKATKDSVNNHLLFGLSGLQFGSTSIRSATMAVTVVSVGFVVVSWWW